MPDTQQNAKCGQSETVETNSVAVEPASRMSFAFGFL